MHQINPKPSALAEWYTLVYEAQEVSGHYFNDCVQHYLVMTLNHAMNDSELCHRMLTIGFLEAFSPLTLNKGQQLRSVGDECLILTGLFPDNLIKKGVSLDYVIELGKNAYHSISEDHCKTHDPDLYRQLSSSFVGLLDILHYTRHLNNTHNLF